MEITHMSRNGPGDRIFVAADSDRLVLLDKDLRVKKQVSCSGIRDLQWVDGALWVNRMPILASGYSDIPRISVYDPDTLEEIDAFAGRYGHIGHKF